MKDKLQVEIDSTVHYNYESPFPIISVVHAYFGKIWPSILRGDVEN